MELVGYKELFNGYITSVLISQEIPDDSVYDSVYNLQLTPVIKNIAGISLDTKNVLKEYLVAPIW
jgi:hypothetical protein